MIGHDVLVSSVKQGGNGCYLIGDVVHKKNGVGQFISEGCRFLRDVSVKDKRKGG